VRNQPYGFTVRGLKHVVTSWLVRAVAWVVRHVPARWLPAIGSVTARVLALLTRKRQQLAEHNIRMALEEDISDESVREIRLRCLRNAVMTMMELLRLPITSRQELIESVSVSGLEHLDGALSEGRGVLAITAHFGNWELCGARIVAGGYPMTAVARDAAHSGTARTINSARESVGLSVIQRGDTREMLRVLRRNGILAILPDQHVVDGVLVNFMGRPAMTATGPVRLAMKTGCRIVPAFCSRAADDSLHVELEAPLELMATGDAEADISANTQLMNDAIGASIRKRPEQWLWLHNRWKISSGGGPQTR